MDIVRVQVEVAVLIRRKQVALVQHHVHVRLVKDLPLITVIVLVVDMLAQTENVNVLVECNTLVEVVDLQHKAVHLHM